MTVLVLPALLLFAETPEKTVQAFVDAFNARDSAAMARQVVGQKDGRFPFAPDFPMLKATVGEAKVQGKSATVDVDLVATGGSASKEETFRETVSLRNVGGDWQIVPLDPGYRSLSPSGPQKPLAGLAMLVSNPQIMGQARSAAKSTASLSNVKQIALATLMYASDHKDRFPNAANFKAALMPYLRNGAVFTAPDAPKGKVSYFLDPRLSGKSIASIPRPAETAMILQGNAKRTVFLYRGRTPLGYVDGHAKLVDPAKVMAARKAPLG